MKKRSLSRKRRNQRRSESVLAQVETLEDRCVPVYAPTGAEFLVNTGYTTNDQQFPAVAMDTSGNFVIAWVSNGQTNGLDVYAQRYDSSGTALGSAFLVNSTNTAGDQLAPVVAMSASGPNARFVISWTNKNSALDGSGDSLWAKVYNADGTTVTSEFRVNQYTTYNQNDSSVAMDPTGNFVISWSSGTQNYEIFAPQAQDGAFYGVYARRYNSSGTAQGNEFRVNSHTSSFEALSSVAMDNSGNFVVTWTELLDGLPNFENGAIFAQRFNSSGTKVGSAWQVNNYDTGYQFLSSVSADAVGNFVIVWSSDHVGANKNDVYARRYNSSGTALDANEWRVNTYTTGHQLVPTVAMDDAGNFVVTWQSGAPADQSPPPAEQQDGSLYGVYAQRYTSAGAADGPELKVSTYTTGNQYFANIGMNPSNSNFVITWASAGQDGSGFGTYAQRFAPNSDPIANAGGPYFTSEGNGLALSASGSSDPDGQPLTYSWDINGDNVFGDAIGVTPNLTWANLVALGINDGVTNRTVKVQVSDPYGGTTTSAGTTLTMYNIAPSVSISTPYPSLLVRGESALFTLTATDPSPVDQASTFDFYVDWDGNGTWDTYVPAPSGTVISRAFSANGSYNVKILALDKDAAASTIYTLPVTVQTWVTRPNASNPLLTDLVYGAPTSGSNLYFQGTAPNTVKITDYLTSTTIGPVSGITGIVVFWGQGGADLLTVTDLNGLTANLGWGNDSVKGTANGGTYTIIGSEGNDSVLFFTSTGANISMDGGNGDDGLAVATGSSGTYSLIGGGGNDQLLLLDGTSVNLSMDGGANDDQVIVGSNTNGSMTLTGGAGFDGFFLYSGDNLSGTISGGDDDDTVVNVTSNATLSVDLGSGNDSFFNFADPPTTMTVLGGSGDDIVASIAGTDSMDGGIGNDLLIGGVAPGDGNDTILGGDGNDVIIGGEGADSLRGGNGEDLIIAGSLSDIYFGDEETPGVIQVWLQWTTGDPFATRIAYLTGTSGGIIDPAFYMVAGTTVLNDGSVDTVLGEGDADWLLYDFATDVASDYTPGTDSRTDL